MSKAPRFTIAYDFDGAVSGWNVFEVVRVAEKAPSYAEAKKIQERLRGRSGGGATGDTP